MSITQIPGKAYPRDLVAHDREHEEMGLRFGAASGNSVITSYGVRAYDTCATNITIGTTTLTHTLSNERPRFQTYTRKCTMSGNAAQIRFASASFTADQTENAFSIDIYLETAPSEYKNQYGGANPYIDIQLSNTTSLGSNYTRRSYSAQYLRQGWNTFKVRKDDTVSGTAGAGNLPTGMSRAADVGTGFDWTGTGQYFAITFNNMDTEIVHIDELRRPAKAKTVITIGFDAAGYNATDEVFYTKVAPLFAQYGIKSYVTMTNIYELIYSTGQAWDRIGRLYNEFGWDAVNHSWSHGATEVGKVMTTTLSRTSNVVTATATAHGIPQNKMCKVAIRGATPSDMNGVFDVTVTGANTFTYTAAGADGSGSGTIKGFTYLSEVFDSNTAENQRLLKHELTDITRVLNGNGYHRSMQWAALPNNSVPELSLLQTVAADAGIKFVRAYRGGYTFVNELGCDNPLNMGSVMLDSGATSYTKTSDIQTKVQGAIDRGDHLHIFGHFILDDEDASNSAYFPVDGDYPPAQGGNPNPPSASQSVTGGWWYLSQLRNLIEDTIGPAIASGDVIVLSPSEYAAYMGAY